MSGGGLITTNAAALFPTPTPTQIIPSPSTTSILPSLSPTLPFPFILPTAILPTPLDPPPQLSPDVEFATLAHTDKALRQSGWYHDKMTYVQSQELLKDTPIGTFLIRESSDPNYLYSLSVQTERGATSVRIHYQQGYFRLDAQAHILPVMPVFPSVIALVEHYVEVSRARRKGAHVWVDQRGKWYSDIALDKPLKREGVPSSLKHLSRLAVHKAIKQSGYPKLDCLPAPYLRLELPASVRSYLAEYPYSI